VRRLILRIARETGWGYTRILGETRKLGVGVSRSTVVNILREAGIPPVSGRGEPSWDEFVRAHAKTLWACDFMARRVVTPRGLKRAFVLVFIHVGSRRVIASPSTVHPDAAWVSTQAARFVRAARTDGGECGVLVRDSDSKFGRAFDAALRAAGVTPLRLPHLAPNLNAHAERLIQTVQDECLDRFIALGTTHLDHLVEQFVEHYNLERPHSAIGFRTPAGPPFALDRTVLGGVECRCRLGGTLRHYHRRAA
jgi:putative transposase